MTWQLIMLSDSSGKVCMAQCRYIRHATCLREEYQRLIWNVRGAPHAGIHISGKAQIIMQVVHFIKGNVCFADRSAQARVLKIQIPMPHIDTAVIAARKDEGAIL